MDFLSKLNEKLDELHLLKHDFYKHWTEGNLPLNVLATYAKEYYGHVEAFPRYVSYVHANCEKIEDRQILLGNLIEEEQGENNHPKLWRDFAHSLGVIDEELKEQNIKETKELIDGYYDLVRKDYATGLGALYAYERQTSEVSKSKIDGLKKHYNIDSKEAIEFFNVHIEADKWHSEEVEKLIESCEDKESVKNGAIKGANLLWSFLDGMQKELDNHSC